MHRSRSVGRVFALVAPLLAALGGAAVGGCGGPKPPEAAPGTSTVPPSAGDKAVSQTKTADAGKLIKELVFPENKVRVEECLFDTPPTGSTNDAVKSIARAGDSLYVANGTNELTAYRLSPGCKLALDRTVGAAGKVKIDGNVDVVRADDKGTVTASTGVFDAYRVTPGE